MANWLLIGLLGTVLGLIGYLAIMIDRGVSDKRKGIILIALFVLCAAALAYSFALPHLAIAAMVLAMGLENAVFQIQGGSGLGLTYVTGALVKVGQLLAAAISGGPRWGWLPNLLLWAALVAGAVAGALAYARFNLGAIWIAAGVALALATVIAAGAKRVY